uniref:Uncharacterized protein n=1 Tax=Branchiostoma floridae TaxID=7739 RepID=C3YTZ7_BRAFL|eukprot:XP_002600262.1 hypothetical protein BRAFLDRAFT_66769 [Branchiostoma floridae]
MWSLFAVGLLLAAAGPGLVQGLVCQANNSPCLNGGVCETDSVTRQGTCMKLLVAGKIPLTPWQALKDPILGGCLLQEVLKAEWLMESFKRPTLKLKLFQRML